MTRELRPYPEYKDSGDGWLGKVPAHWGTIGLGAISHRRSERNRPDLPLLSVLREKGVVLRSSLAEEENHNFIPEDLSNYRAARAGDLVVNKMKAWQGSVGIAPTDGIVSPAYFVFELSGITKEYAHRLLRCRLYADYFARASDGVRIGQWDLSINQMKRIPVVIPPVEEQGEIVRYLDVMDRRIRRFIRNRRRLIEVLNEQKHAIINRAVTCGLDPNVPLKPSGIDWLGEIPEHWDIWKIGQFARVGNGSTPSRGTMAYWQDGDYPWLNSSTVNSGTIKEADQFVTTVALKECHLPRVEPGSVLVAITGQGKTRGTAAVLQMHATINQHLAYITPRGRQVAVNPEFLRAFLIAAYPELRRMSNDSGSTKGALTCGDLRHFQVAIPPEQDQAAVVARIKNDTQEVEAALRVATREIDLIREYRTRLIADVVTGKVDVRDIKVPEVAEEELLVLDEDTSESDDVIEDELESELEE